MKYAIAGIAALLLAGPQVALAEDAETEDSDKVTCKYQRLLGSKIPEKVCRTRAAWEELERQQIEQRRTDRVRNRNSGGN